MSSTMFLKPQEPPSYHKHEHEECNILHHLKRDEPPSPVSIASDSECHSSPPSSIASITTTEDLLETTSTYCVRGMNPHPVVMVEGKGSYLWDAEGHKYLDFLSAFSAASQGHCHPRVVEAMIKQCQKLMLPSRAVHNEWYPRLCRRVCELLGFDQAAAANSGSEAVDFAIKAARKWGHAVKNIPEGESWIVTAASNFHGRTLGPVSASDRDLLKEGLSPLIPNIGASLSNHTIRFGSTADIELLFSQHGQRIAAFMIEPIQGHAGCIVPPAGYLRSVRALCTKYNILFIADEVQCGLGRTGYLSACEAEGVKPDLMILGKAIVGGAYAMGMVLGSREVMGLFRDGQHGSTFGGNPLVCAVAMAALDVLVDEDLPVRARRLESVLRNRLGSVKSPYYGGVIGKGLLCSFIVKETHPQGRVTAARLTKLLLRRGVLSYPYGNMIRIAPPLVISDEELLWGLDRIEEALHDLEYIEEGME